MKKTIKPIVVEHNITGSGHDFTNVAQFHTSFKFPAHCRIIDHDAYLTDADVLAIRAMPGVTETACYDHQGLYGLIVKKGTAFDWDELEPAIMGLLLARHERLSEAAMVNGLVALDKEDDA